MDKKLAGLLGAAAAVTTVGTAHATTSPAADGTAATSYRALLEPVANALALLQQDQARRSPGSAGEQIRLAQFHHHHHHHHHGFFGGVVVPPFVPGPRCYWTLGRPYWNGYAWVRPRVRVCD